MSMKRTKPLMPMELVEWEENIRKKSKKNYDKLGEIGSMKV